MSIIVLNKATKLFALRIFVLGYNIKRIKNMVKHVVLFKLGPFTNADERISALQDIRHALLALKEKVDVLRHIEVGVNMNPEEQFDLSLITEFDSMDDLNTYATHPDHVAVSKGLIAPLKLDRACVDYLE